MTDLKRCPHCGGEMQRIDGSEEWCTAYRDGCAVCEHEFPVEIWNMRPLENESTKKLSESIGYFELFVAEVGEYLASRKDGAWVTAAENIYMWIVSRCKDAIRRAEEGR